MSEAGSDAGRTTLSPGINVRAPSTAASEAVSRNSAASPATTKRQNSGLSAVQSNAASNQKIDEEESPTMRKSVATLQPTAASSPNSASPSTARPPTSPAAGVSRQGSQQGDLAATVRSPLGQSTRSGVQPLTSPAAESLSRQQSGSAFQRQGSRASGASQPASQASRKSSLASSKAGSVLAEVAKVDSVAGPPSAVGSARAMDEAEVATPAGAPEEDEFAGVDWRLTANTVRGQVEQLKEKLAAESKIVADLREENARLTARCSELERTSTANSDSDKVAALKAQLANKDRQIKDLEKKARGMSVDSSQSQSLVVRRKDQQIADLQAELERAKSHAGPSPQLQQHIEHLQTAVQNKDMEIMELKAAVRQLQNKLEQAQEAIVSATDYGWENDIKLAQARRALISILDHHSPERVRKSPRRKKRHDEEDKRLQLQQKIAELEEAKMKAVEREEYGEAQRLLQEVTALKAQLSSGTP